MGEPVVLLSRPGRGFDVVDAREICSPGRLSSHFIELAVLYHHRMNDTQETLIRREDTSSTSESISLQETLAGMLAEDLDDTASLSVGELVPLKVSACVVEYCIKLVADQFIWRKDSKRFWVVN